MVSTEKKQKKDVEKGLKIDTSLNMPQPAKIGSLGCYLKVNNAALASYKREKNHSRRHMAEKNNQIIVMEEVFKPPSPERQTAKKKKTKREIAEQIKGW